METFSFTLLLEGLEMDDFDAVAAIGEAGDVVIAEHGGVVTAIVAQEGADARDAVRRAIESLEAAAPGTRVVGIDPELVAIRDIADRTGRSRESIRLLVDGRRGPGGFPPPLGVVGDGIRIWRWADVNAWFRERLGEGDELASIPPLVATSFNALLGAGALQGEVPPEGWLPEVTLSDGSRHTWNLPAGRLANFARWSAPLVSTEDLARSRLWWASVQGVPEPSPGGRATVTVEPSDEITLNFGSEQPEALPEGVYEVVVERAHLDTSAAGNRFLRLGLAVANGNFAGHRLSTTASLEEGPVWKVKEIVTALLGETPKGSYTFTPEDLVGLRSAVQVGVASSGERSVSEVLEWFPTTTASAAAQPAPPRSRSRSKG